VKWLTEIDVIDEAFDGYFQTEKYVYEFEQNGRVSRDPVRLQKVRALITQPAEGEVVSLGPLAVRGLAWSGAAPIKHVEVSLNSERWRPARLIGESGRYEWRRWELITKLDHPGRTTIRARATDAAGHRQPEQPDGNRLGYGNNAVHALTLVVRT
jgi:DMSO/TMAO reductase YedYZ molybdopterin-dependent catalytic subunit